MPLRCVKCDELIPSEGETLPLVARCPTCESTRLQAATTELAPRRLKAGDRLAEFTLQAELGSGGHGVVFRAHDEKLDRVVALKISRFVGGSLELQQLLLHEARAMARLQHPNVVRALGAGVDEDTLFIVNDFVDGLTLEKHSGNAPMPAAQSVDICIQIASALDHAHGLGIIHRDLKPSNVLINQEDQAFLTDFGLASRTATASAFRGDNDVIGTPAYMSPEQAFGKSNDAGPSSDVYSLGVVLYELLTGERPFRGTSESLIMQTRFVDPPSMLTLNNKLPQDLDTIVLKCLEKQPSRRFSSAAELAAEMRRWREGRPILSRPISRADRAWRCAKRNPLVASLSFACFASLIAGLFLSSQLAFQAQRQSVAAQQHAAAMENARDQAQLHLHETVDSIDTLLIRVANETFHGVPKAERVREEIVADAASQFDKLLLSNPTDQHLLTACTNAHIRLGSLKQNMGDTNGSEQEIGNALKLVQKLDSSVQNAILHSDALRRMSSLHAQRNEYDSARKYATDALRILNQQCPAGVKADKTSENMQRALMRCYAAIGRVNRITHSQNAIDYFERAKGIAISLVNENPESRVDLRELMHITQNLSATYRPLNDDVSALRVLREAFEKSETLTQQDKVHPTLLNQHASILARLAETLIRAKSFDEAKEVTEQSISIRRTLVRDYPSTPNFVEGLAHCHTLLSLAEEGLGDFQLARRWLRKSLSLRREVILKFGASSKTLAAQAKSHRGLALLLGRSGRSREAAADYRQAIECWKQADTTGGLSPGAVRAMSQVCRALVRLHVQFGENDIAEEYMLQAIAVSEKGTQKYTFDLGIAVEVRKSHGVYATFLAERERIDEATKQTQLASAAKKRVDLIDLKNTNR